METMEKPEKVDWSHERERLQMRIAVLEESVKCSEVECKGVRETVLRLVSELDQERRKSTSTGAALTTLKLELDGVNLQKQSVVSENQTLTQRLEAAHRVVEAARSESECLDKQLKEVERRLQTSQGQTQTAEGNLRNFLEKVAGVLQQSSEHSVLPTQDHILHKVNSLCNKKVSSLQEKLSEQTELHHKVLQRADQLEEEVQHLNNRLQWTETELMNTHMQDEQLQRNNKQYEEFLQKLSETLKVESISVDLDSDMRLNLILSRTQQLVKQEGSALVESRTITYSLQRKLKSQKDQLESKGLHVQLLRKKVCELEEQRRGGSAAFGSAASAGDAQIEIRRLLKRVEQLQSELKTTKASNSQLRKQLMHTDELKLKVEEQKQMIEEQKNKVDQLEERKMKVEKKMNTVSSDLKNQEKKSRGDQQQLSMLRLSVDQLVHRQTELLDFRMVISQMIGIDTLSLALPNCEIIQKLERILHTHHLHCCDRQSWSCPGPHTPHLHNSSSDVSTSRSTALLHQHLE